MKRILTPFSLFILLVSGLLTNSCRKDPLDTDPTAKLLFSRDTVTFDTVFTTVGSTYRRFKAFNTSSQTVRISSIKLAGGANSQFTLNVDGLPGREFSDVDIRGGDSLWMFAEVNVDPTSQNSPMLILDSILFETNGNRQTIILQAVGQDVYLHYPTNVSSNGVGYSYFNCNDVWTNDKPHLVFGLAIIPQNCSLTMQAGTRVHMHKGAVIAADSNATLQIQGTFGNEVTIQGDRLEMEYREEPGQWGYVWLSANSVNNDVNWAIVKNGTIGFLVDSIGSSPNPTLNIRNTKVRNMTLAGLFGRDSHIRGGNLVVNNCGQYCAALAYGGNYTFTHCTFANYWNIDERNEPAIIVTNWYEDADGNPIRRDLDSAHFFNCIIAGALDNEFEVDSNTANGTFAFNYQVAYSMLRTNLNFGAHPNNFVNIVPNGNPMFPHPQDNDFTILAGSPAINLGNPLYSASFPFDIVNFNRFTSGNPDAGALEHQP